MKKRLIILSAFLIISININSQSIVGKNKLWKEGDKEYVKPEALESKLYKDNIGKIVFSKEEIDPNGDGSQLKNTFKFGETIYCKAILETGLGNYKIYSDGKMTDEKSNGYTVFIFIDSDKGIDTWKPRDGGENKYITHTKMSIDNKKHLSFQLQKTEEFDKKHVKKFSDALNAVAVGSHTIKLVMWGGCSGISRPLYPVATGEFTYVK